MGAYFTLYFDSLPVLSGKNGISGDLMSVFSDSERKVLVPKEVLERAPFISLVHEDEDSQEELYYLYQTRASYVRDRLDIMGISLAKIRQAFDIGIEEHRHFELEDSPISSHEEVRREMSEHKISRGLKNDLDDYTFDRWYQLAGLAVNRGLGIDDLNYKRFDFLESETFDWFSDTYGFPSYSFDMRLLLRVLLDHLPGDHAVTLDYTDLVHSGYEDENALLCEEAKYTFAHDYSISEKIVVLTEGTTDILFLKNALRLLYPHIQDNFAFADFSEVKAQGGAPSLVGYIKVLASMSIKNRVIAIFDADAAAEDALRSIKDINLPNNIRVMQLPHLDVATSYPTVGPTGNVDIDINGLACSTELYLPREILVNTEGVYYPVHWRGYIQSLGKYQGEVSGKRDIMNAFIDLVKSIDAGKRSVADYDWRSMHSIFEAMFLTLAGE